MESPGRSGGFYFAIHNLAGTSTVDRQKGAFRHYVQYLESGEYTYYTDQGTFHLKGGDLFYLPKGLGFRGSYTDARLHSCGFTVFPEAEYESFSFQLLPEQFIHQFLQIPKNIAPDTQALASFYSLLAQLLPYMQHTSQAWESTLISKLRVYLWGNCTCQVSDMAKHCKISVPHLYRLLKEEANKTPNQIKQEVQIEKAMVLLNRTNASIRQISEELGFSNPNYFGQLFKHHTGKTPSQFRQVSATDELSQAEDVENG